MSQREVKADLTEVIERAANRLSIGEIRKKKSESFLYSGSGVFIGVDGLVNVSFQQSRNQKTKTRLKVSFLGATGSWH